MKIFETTRLILRCFYRYCDPLSTCLLNLVEWHTMGSWVLISLNLDESSGKCSSTCFMSTPSMRTRFKLCGTCADSDIKTRSRNSRSQRISIRAYPRSSYFILPACITTSPKDKVATTPNLALRSRKSSASDMDSEIGILVSFAG